MNKLFKEVEFTPEDIYEELLKSGIKFELNEEYKYLEETNKSEPTYEEFVKFMSSLNKSYKYLGTITPSDEAIEEINKLIEESNKQIKKPFPYRNIDNITIDDVGDWNIEGDNL